MHRFRPRFGFTLVEMSIVLVIVALITGSGVMMGSSVIESSKVANTNNKLNVIEAALLAYRLGYDRLPCPADLSLTSTSANYGIEGATAGTCTGGSPAANSSYSYHSTYTVEGGVPTKTLSLPDEYMVDGWGRKFVYAVWAPFTGTGGMTTYRVNPSCGNITVKNAGGTNRTTSGAYALVSFGPDGHGGYTGTGTRYNAASTNTDEQTNAHYSNLGANTSYTATYVQKDWTTNPADAKDIFDDTVRYKERWQLTSEADKWSTIGSTCLLGFRIDGYENGQQVAYRSTIAVGDVNNDGYKDLIIGAPGATDSGGHASTGKVFVVFGSSTGTDPLVLNTLDGTNGFELDGVYSVMAPQVGLTVAVGDVNGDGIDDIVTSGMGAGAGGTRRGQVYVIFGHSGSWNAAYTLNTAFLNGTNGSIYEGSYVNEFLGGGLMAEDVNNDGIKDIIITTAGANLDGAGAYGSVMVLFGHTAASYAWPGVITTLNAAFFSDGTKEVAFNGVQAVAAGINTLAVGDVNNDGVKDILVGCQYCAMNGLTYSGVAWVIFGKAAGWPNAPTTLDSTYLDGTKGVEFDGAVSAGSVRPGLGTGGAIADVNGDNIKDLVIGANAIDHGNIGVGGIYTIFGHANPWVSPQTVDATYMNATNGFILWGSVTTGYFGTLLTLDMNGDGIQDIVTSGLYNPGGRVSAGEVFVIFGRQRGGSWPSAWPYSSVSLASAAQLDGTYGFELDGLTAGDRLGWSNGWPMSGGDVNNDGIADLIVNASYATANGTANAGKIYVVFGKASGWAATTTISTLVDGVKAVEFDGTFGGADLIIFGAKVTDMNHDGINDLIFPCNSCTAGGLTSGLVYVYYGKTANWPTAAWSLGNLGGR